MSITQISISECIDAIHNNELYLPAIQRKMVWKQDKIINFFDSLLRGYPIGTFIFWKLNNKIIKTYPFYKFLNNFDERHENNNELIQRNILKSKSLGVLDGQQRLSSIYLGLTGDYTYKMKGKSKKFENTNFITSKLYINLFENKEFMNQSFNKYELSFLSEIQKNKIDNKHFWFELGEILNLKSESAIEKNIDLKIGYFKKDIINIKVINKLVREKSRIIKILKLIRKKFQTEKVLLYNSVSESNIEKVVEIFQRVNSGGMELTKADLLFARLVSKWPKGRNKVENTIKELKNVGVNVDVEFIVRICLTLCDLPVLYRESNLKDDKKIKIIEDNWSNIVESLRQTGLLLNKFGFNKNNLRSKNSIIPIAYYISKGGNIREYKVRKNLRKYLIVSHVKNIFSGQGDNVLTKIRDGLTDKQSRKLLHKKFEYSDLHKIKLSGNKDFRINRAFIKENLLEKEKGPESFMLLTLLYKNVDYFKNKFEMDHIHPTFQFSRYKLKKLFNSEQKIDKWIKLKNKISNLQILVGEVNQNKHQKSLNVWLKELELNETGAKRHFIKENYLPIKTDYDISNFEKFYNKRKRILYRELVNQLLK